MITLKRDGKVMKVSTELQASVFLRNGYKRVEKAPADKVITPEKKDFATNAEQDKETAPNAEPESDLPVTETKKRRRRIAKASE